MATVLLRPLLRPRTLGLGLGVSIAAFHTIKQRPARLDSAGGSSRGVEEHFQSPVPSQRWMGRRTARQISSGSIIGLCAGLVTSTFSRSLALLLGVIVASIQWAASLGVDILPYKRIQQYVTSIDVKSAIQDDPAFKIAFGTSFALAAFVHF